YLNISATNMLPVLLFTMNIVPTDPIFLVLLLLSLFRLIVIKLKNLLAIRSYQQYIELLTTDKDNPFLSIRF
ncbi:hypothetical protein R0J93_19935, partial [Pseudoalteromonas sp. SIMBA_148]